MRAACDLREIQSHVPEPFWEIKVAYRGADGKSCDFRWRVLSHHCGVNLCLPYDPGLARSWEANALGLPCTYACCSAGGCRGHYSLNSCTTASSHTEHESQSQPPCAPWCLSRKCRWTRGRLFDHVVATMLYEPCVTSPTATVLKVLADCRPLALDFVWALRLEKGHPAAAAVRSGCLREPWCRCPVVMQPAQQRLREQMEAVTAADTVTQPCVT
jgi:hypothetical protein